MRLVTIIISEANYFKNVGQYSMYLSFLYDSNMIEYLRNLRAFYNPDYKDWELPLSLYNKVITRLKDNNILFEIQGDPYITSNNIKSYCKTKPYAHQLEFLTYAINHPNFLLGDEMGLGKSREIIDLALYLKENEKLKHCLIICGINGTKYNWLEEIKIHSNETAHILGTHLSKEGKLIEDSTEKKLKDLESCPKEFFWILNVESLRYQKNNIFVMTQAINELSYSGELGLIALDESHKCKTPDSLQGRALLHIQCARKIAMSGTFLLNNPLDLYMPLKWCGFENHTFWAYKNYYCIFGNFGTHDIKGYRNLSHLHDQLERCMLRRTKAQVLDLPPKMQIKEFVEMNKEQAKLYKEMKKLVLENIDKISISPDPLSEMLRLRQITGLPELLSSKVTKSAKLERLLELVKEVTTSNHKCIIFSNWTSVTSILKEKLKEYNCAYITGEINAEKRMDEVNKFQNNPTCKVIIGTTGAMGTGLTLTAANTVIFFDEPWNRALKDQAEERAYRVGTKSTVNVITLVTKNTIDEAIYNLVQKKGKMADMLVDGKFTVYNRSQIINYLLK